MEIVLLSGAESDLFEAWVQCEERSPGLGGRFDAAIRTGLLQLVAFPESGPIYAGDFRRLLIRRFQHGIFYRIHRRRVVVTAVLDSRRDPAAIRRRLRP